MELMVLPSSSFSDWFLLFIFLFLSDNFSLLCEKSIKMGDPPKNGFDDSFDLAIEASSGIALLINWIIII